MNKYSIILLLFLTFIETLSVTKKGDNILKVYVNSLNTDSYTIELTDNNHVIIGRDVFGKQ